MSVKVSSWVWHEASKEIGGNELVVLLALADVASDSGVCSYFEVPEDATQTALARKARVHRATLVRCIDSLVERGVLVKGRGKQHDPNSYRIQMSHSATTGDSQMSHSVDQMSQTGDSDVANDDVAPLTVRIDVTTRGGAQKRAARIPEPFIVTAAMREWAAAEVPSVSVDGSTRMFVDYWRAESGARAAKRDWVAAWRNWLRKDAQGSRGSVRQSKDDRALTVVEMGRQLAGESSKAIAS